MEESIEAGARVRAPAGPPAWRTRGAPALARLLSLIGIVGIVYALTLPFPGVEGPASATMRLGFLLVAAYLAGQVARHGGLPQITGYLLLGLLVGPYALSILTHDTVERFRLVDEIALSLIALSAGGELRIPSIRERLRSIGTITAVQVVLVFTTVSVLVYFARDLIGFLSGRPARAAEAVALLFGLVAVANSPATTIAVITEEKADGVLTRTVLGLTVVKDVLILILMALLIPLAAAIMDPTKPFAFAAVEQVIFEIAASLAVGAAFGLAIARTLHHVDTRQVLVVLAAAFLSVELAERFGLEYILISMAAGFMVQNFSGQGDELVRALEANSLPIYALFFAVAGAGLDIPALREVWPIALVIIVARLVSVAGSTWIGARLAGDGAIVRRHAWSGFVAMAGVTLGIANLIRDRFPELGGSVAAIIIAIIAVNQFIGPPIFRYALVRSRESQARR